MATIVSGCRPGDHSPSLLSCVLFDRLIRCDLICWCHVAVCRDVGIQILHVAPNWKTWWVLRFWAFGKSFLLSIIHLWCSDRPWMALFVFCASGHDVIADGLHEEDLREHTTWRKGPQKYVFSLRGISFIHFPSHTLLTCPLWFAVTRCLVWIRSVEEVDIWGDRMGWVLLLVLRSLSRSCFSTSLGISDFESFCLILWIGCRFEQNASICFRDSKRSLKIVHGGMMALKNSPCIKFVGVTRCFLVFVKRLDHWITSVTSWRTSEWAQRHILRLGLLTRFVDDCSWAMVYANSDKRGLYVLSKLPRCMIRICQFVRQLILSFSPELMLFDTLIRLDILSRSPTSTRKECIMFAIFRTKNLPKWNSFFASFFRFVWRGCKMVSWLSTKLLCRISPFHFFPHSSTTALSERYKYQLIRSQWMYIFLTLFRPCRSQLAMSLTNVCSLRPMKVSILHELISDYFGGHKFLWVDEGYLVPGEEGLQMSD